MGGRGAASGEYDLHGKHFKYGEEYHSISELNFDNVKFIKRNNGSASAPLETMVDPERKPNGRIYVTVSNDDKVRYISFYDKNGKRYRTMDLNDHKHIDRKTKTDYTINHAHNGYNHNENGDGFLTKTERHFAADILQR